MVSNNIRFANRAKLSLPKAVGSFSDRQEIQTEMLDAASPEAAFSDAVTGVETVPKVEETAAVQPEPIATEETVLQAEPAPAEVASSFPAESFALEQVITPVTAIPNLRSTVTSASCIKALEKSLNFGRSAFYLEVGVCLAIFSSSSTGTDLPTKRAVMDVYSQAGFEVKVGEKDYKTVNRRVNICAKLFDTLGADVVNGAMRGLRDGKAIESLCSYLGDTRKFDTMYAVLEFVGEPVAQTNTPEVRAARSAALVRSLSSDTATDITIDERVAAQREVRAKKEQEQTEGITVMTSTLTINLPRDVTSFEVRAMASKLIEFAERMEEELGTPADQRNREMHS